jgi:hypothetical protein
VSVKNVTRIDIALVELLNAGKTAAPPDVLDRLRAKGHVTTTGGKPALTPKGRRRAQGLRAAEHDLRLMFRTAAAGESPMTTVGGSTLHVGGGGPARISG